MYNLHQVFTWMLCNVHRRKISKGRKNEETHIFYEYETETDDTLTAHKMNRNENLKGKWINYTTIFIATEKLYLYTNLYLKSIGEIKHCNIILSNTNQNSMTREPTIKSFKISENPRKEKVYHP